MPGRAGTRREHRKATSMNGTEIGRVTPSDGTSIAYERVGTGPAVILVATAHTLVYDSLIPGTMPPDRLAAITTPALVAGSKGSPGQLRNWAQRVAEALPDASARFLPGTWHGVSAEHLAPALAEFFTGR